MEAEQGNLRDLRSNRRHTLTIEGFDMTKKQRAQVDGSQALPQPSHSSTPQRRGSFLYRSNSDFEVSPKVSRNSSVASDQHPDDVIITPFAQILNSLHSAYDNFKTVTARLTESTLNKDTLLTTTSTTTPTTPTKPTTTPPVSTTLPKSTIPMSTNTRTAKKPTEDKITEEDEEENEEDCTTDEHYIKMANEALKLFDWSLEQLEKVQTDKAVSEMARNKFKKLLSNEMTRCAESSKSGIQISEYICRTFLDQEIDMSNSNQTKNNMAQQLLYQHQLQQQQLQPKSGHGGFLLPHPFTNHKETAVRGRGITSIDEEDDTLLTEAAEASTESELMPSQVTTEVADFLTDIDSWGVDMFDLADLTSQKPLTTVTMHILKKRNLLQNFKICEKDFFVYMTVAESRYNATVPYHNCIHAADVTQSSHFLLSIPTLQSVFTDLEIFATIFACAIHDTDHPGLTNQYLINTFSNLALMYNDESVLENYHVSTAFQIMQQPNCDFLAPLDNNSRQMFRKMVISIVLATDMNKHMNHLAHLKTMAETRSISGENDLRLNSYSERIQVLQSLIHCSDLSNPTKSLQLYRRWNDLITQEFYNQGDEEKKRGLEVSAMCDRTSSSLEKNQVSFIDYIVHPLWEAWADLVHPHCQFILETLQDNRQWYSNIVGSPAN